jgi:sigma-B regulation protein RsbU (phosphoserine phosphatase)
MHPHHTAREDELTHFLLEIAEAANAPLDLDRLLERIAGLVKKVIDYEIFAILLMAERTQELRVRFEIGHTPDIKKLRIKVGKGVTGTAADLREAVVVPDVSKFEGYIAARDNVRSEMAVPMILKNRVIGVIDIQSDQPNYFTDRHRDLVTLLAGRVALTVENARLFRSTAKQAKIMATLVAISRELTVLRLNELLPKIADLLRRLIGFDAFSISLVDEERQVIFDFFRVVFNQRVKTRDAIPLGKGVCGAAIDEQKAMLVPDVSKEPRYINMNPAARSELAVPLVVKGRAIGVLDLESTKKGFFTPEHRQMMELLAPQVAIAVENARLYDDLAKKEKRLERDMEAARELQMHLLPQCCPEIPGLDLFARYEPAREIGGDLYEFVRHVNPDGDGGGDLVIFAGDVSGKGAPAALYAALVTGILRNVASLRLAPSEMLVAINDALTQRRIESRYVALCCAHLDLGSFTLEVANAGLPHPILCRGGEILPSCVEGVPLGLLPGLDYDRMILELQPEDVLVFFSDGVIESLNENREEFGRERLGEVVAANWRETSFGLVEAIYEHTRVWGSGRAGDDQTVVALKVLARP